MILTIH